MRMISEPAREIKVLKEADVVIVGGGPGGVASAIAAARMGAKTVLIERYGYLGGMATGGLINIFPQYERHQRKARIFGLNQEIIDRMKARNAAFSPTRKTGEPPTEKSSIIIWNANMGWFYVRKDPNIGGRERVHYTAVLDPEVLKDELNDMVAEAGADLLLHSWGTRPIVEGNTVKGVFF